MNQVAEKDLEDGCTWFYSRSRKKLWNKGKLRNVQKVMGISMIVMPTLLVQVEQTVWLAMRVASLV